MLIIEAPQDITSAILWALCGLVVAMGMALVYVIKTKKNGNGRTTGELDPAYWLVILNDIKAKIELVDAAVGTNHGELTAIRSHLHELRNSLNPLSLAVQILTEEIKRRK